MSLALLAALLAVTTGGAVLADPPASHPGTVPPSLSTAAAPAQGFSSTNGVIRVTFPSARPEFTVTDLANPTTTVGQNLSGVAEVTAGGTIVSFGNFLSGNVSWTMTSGTQAGITTVALSARVPVVRAQGEWESGDDNTSSPWIGNVSVSLDFAFNASQGIDPSTLGYSMQVTRWPWLNASDSLGLEVRSMVDATVGYWRSIGTNSVAEVSRSTQANLAVFTWESTAQAWYSHEHEDQSSVGAYNNYSVNGSSSLVRLTFGTVPGNYTNLSYDPSLEVLSPTHLATEAAALLLTPASLSALGVGSAVVLGLAVVARKRRRPPESDL